MTNCQVLEVLGFTVAVWNCLTNSMVAVGCILQAVTGLAGSRARRKSSLVHVTGDSFSKKGTHVVRVRAMGGRTAAAVAAAVVAAAAAAEAAASVVVAAATAATVAVVA
jgi:hypothetical protein